jgi:tRNA/rRNA methyltransferase
MKIVVVLVKPEFQINLGSVARVMKNFSCTDLRIVKGVKTGKQALRFSMRGKEILQNAKRFQTLDQAVSDCALVVGTSSTPKRFSKDLKPAISIKKIPKKNGIALVFGGEGNGLSRREVSKCDLIATINANPEYPVFNLSHAVALVLYELTERTGREVESCDRKRIKKLSQLFSSTLKNGSFKKKSKIIKAFSNVLFKSNASENEVQALFAGFKFIQASCKSTLPSKPTRNPR